MRMTRHAYTWHTRITSWFRCIVCVVSVVLYGNSGGVDAQHNEPVKVVLFDVDGVLVTPSVYRTVVHGTQMMYTHAGICGIVSILCDVLCGYNPYAYILEHMHTMSTRERAYHIPSRDASNASLPPIIRYWQTGTPGFDGGTIYKKFRHHIAQCATDVSHCNALSVGARMLFDSQFHGKIMTVVPDGERLVRYIRHTYPAVACGVLANYNRESFREVFHTIPSLFRIFDPQYICVSGDIGTRKPDPQIFHAFCHQRGIHPHACLLIDNHPDNVQAARSIGMRGVVCDHTNHDALYAYIDTVCNPDQ